MQCMVDDNKTKFKNKFLYMLYGAARIVLELNTKMKIIFFYCFAKIFANTQLVSQTYTVILWKLDYKKKIK